MRRGNILREPPQPRPQRTTAPRRRGRGRAEAGNKEADGRTCAWPRGARPKRPQRNMTRSPAGALADAGFLLFVHLPTRFAALHSYPKHKRKRCRRLRESRATASSLFRTHRHSETKVLLFPGTAGQGAGAGKKEQSKQCAGQRASTFPYHLSARFTALFTSVTSFASEYFIQLFGNRTFSA